MCEAMKEFEMNRNWPAALRICTLFVVLALSGCYQPVRYPQLVEAPPAAPVVHPARYSIVGTSVHRRPIMCLTLGQGKDVTLIIATIHGDEPAGTPLVRRLATHLRQHPDILNDRKVVLLRLANPDGLAHKSRYNAHGVDLNRNFEAANRINSLQFGMTALSEPEARAIHRVILNSRPDRIVSVHQRAPKRPGCIDYDGPASELAQHMAQYCDLPVTRLGSKPGSLGSYAGLTRNIPIITFEMFRADSQLDSETLWRFRADSQLDSETLWRKYGKALVAAVTYPNPVQ
jgi:protein MpaA